MKITTKIQKGNHFDGRNPNYDNQQGANVSNSWCPDTEWKKKREHTKDPHQGHRFYTLNDLIWDNTNGLPIDHHTTMMK